MTRPRRELSIDMIMSIYKNKFNQTTLPLLYLQYLKQNGR